MKDKALHKILIMLKNRNQKFKELMQECFRRDHIDGIPFNRGIGGGWLKKGEIMMFEEDIEKLIAEALKEENRTDFNSQQARQPHGS